MSAVVANPSPNRLGKTVRKARSPCKVVKSRTRGRGTNASGTVLSDDLLRKLGQAGIVKTGSGMQSVARPFAVDGQRVNGRSRCAASVEAGAEPLAHCALVSPVRPRPHAHTCDSMVGLTTSSELQAVVINLERRPDRMQACAASCETNCPWLSYRRLLAADGRKETIKTSEVALTWHTGLNCVYQKIRSRRKGWNDLDNYEPRELQLSPGERGCSLSHIRAWRHCLELGRPLMVLEDDAVLMPEFDPVLQRALSALPADAQLLYLGYSQAAPWRRELSPELVESEYVWTTVGYVIWPSGAQQLLSTLPVNQPVDNWMAGKCATGNLKAYAVRPKIVRQAEDWNVGSDVSHSDEVLGHVIQVAAGAAGCRTNLSHNTHHSVDVWSDAGVNQQWKIRKTASGLYTIATAVGTSGGRTYLSHDGHHNIDLWCDAGVNQQWIIQKAGQDTYTIQAAVATSEGRVYLGCNADYGVELFPEAGANQHWVIPDCFVEDVSS